MHSLAGKGSLQLRNQLFAFALRQEVFDVIDGNNFHLATGILIFCANVGKQSDIVKLYQLRWYFGFLLEDI